ncbi:hypothetical protein GCM10007362_39610 [Saccharibacillus endophyticus]|uniref:Uncharacterized protein n=1 Tax=Saccharibacillus endophyticus TaxID=2060666 RepID=A0ABQ2A4Q0_9BACL|nr:hypothetical protein GCM10007362_39610 [Saccharibacillus endophyticus]
MQAKPELVRERTFFAKVFLRENRLFRHEFRFFCVLRGKQRAAGARWFRDKTQQSELGGRSVTGMSLSNREASS